MGRLTISTSASINNAITTNTYDALTVSSRLIKSDGTNVVISADSIDEVGLRSKIEDIIDGDGLKKKIMEVLLSDPDSEVKRIAEDYLIQCLYEATEDPEKNPILKRFFSNNKEEIDRLTSDIWEAKNEILQLKTELQALKDKLRINSDGYSYTWNEEQGVAWKNDVQGQFQYLESKLISITEKLGKAGIDINYWEN